jgi:hypothetical protein
MSWSRHYFYTDDVGEDRRKRGYTHRLCPYSTAYKSKFRFIGTLCTGIINGTPQNISGDFVVGNSSNPDFFVKEYSGYLCSDHTTTSGRMVPTSNPPGVLCEDPACYYFTTIKIGVRYKEV